MCSNIAFSEADGNMDGTRQGTRPVSAESIEVDMNSPNLKPRYDGIYTVEELKEVFRKKIEKAEQLKKNARKSIFIKRLIQYWATERSPMLIGSELVEPEVENCLRKLAEDLPEKFRHGTIISVGSMAESMKTNAPDEFDYIYIPKAFQEQNFEIKHTPPEKFKPKGKKPSLYFKVSFKEVPKDWKCEECRNGEIEKDCTHVSRDIVAIDLQEEFQNAIKQIMEQHRVKEPAVLLNGPAVTIMKRLPEVARMALQKMNQETDESIEGDKRDIDLENLKLKRLVVKIDWTIAIKVQKHIIEESIGHDIRNTDNFLLVPSGSFWKLSVNTLEAGKVANLVTKTGRQDCFQAVKFLRDEMDITYREKQESTALSTYPLKIAFLKVNRENKDDSKWEFDSYGDRVFDILSHVENKGSEGQLTHYYFKDEPVLLESDKCYVECRRMQQSLVSMNQTYILHGFSHSCFFAFYLILCIAISVRGGVFIRFLTQNQMASNVTVEHCKYITDIVRAGLVRYLFWQNIIAAILTLLGLFMSIALVAYRYCWYKKPALYRMYRGVMMLYPAAFICALTLLGIGIAMTVQYTQTEGCRAGFSSLILKLSIASIVFAGIPVAYSVVHILLSLCAMRCNCTNHTCSYMYECIFFDKLWKSFFCTRKLKDNQQTKN